MVPTMGMCGPAALDPTVPVSRGARGDPASTEVERELKSMRGWGPRVGVRVGTKPKAGLGARAGPPEVRLLKNTINLKS